MMNMGYSAAFFGPVLSMGDLLTNAAMNTLMGMGTVFAVLLIIILVISSFSLFSKGEGRKLEDEGGAALRTAVKKPEKKPEKKPAERVSVSDRAAAQARAMEEAGDAGELIAVITAAIAAYEDTEAASGYIVREIRRRNR